MSVLSIFVRSKILFPYYIYLSNLTKVMLMKQFQFPERRCQEKIYFRFDGEPANEPMYSPVNHFHPLRVRSKASTPKSDSG